ncbi:MAG: hypothetical protein RIC57_03370 [Balneola sp.]
MEQSILIFLAASLTILVLALLASALEKTLSSSLGATIQNGINDMKANAAFRDAWDRDPNSILYTWRGLLFDMQNMQYPQEEIEAVKRQLKHFERSLKKPQTLVNRNGLVKKTIIGGEA